MFKSCLPKFAPKHHNHHWRSPACYQWTLSPQVVDHNSACFGKELEKKFLERDRSSRKSGNLANLYKKYCFSICTRFTKNIPPNGSKAEQFSTESPPAPNHADFFPLPRRSKKPLFSPAVISRRGSNSKAHWPQRSRPDWRNVCM